MTNVTITVLNGDVPVVGAQVVVGEVFQKSLTTNANGKISKSVPSDFSVFCPIAVVLEGQMVSNSGPMLLQAGGKYTLNIVLELPSPAALSPVPPPEEIAQEIPADAPTVIDPILT